MSEHQIVRVLKQRRAAEQEKLETWGHDCSKGKCAQSRIHLLDGILKEVHHG